MLPAQRQDTLFVPCRRGGGHYVGWSSVNRNAVAIRIPAIWPAQAKGKLQAPDAQEVDAADLAVP
jgi:hypothetical protein